LLLGSHCHTPAFTDHDEQAFPEMVEKARIPSSLRASMKTLKITVKKFFTLVKADERNHLVNKSAIKN
jgi:hypothetical protein